MNRIRNDIILIVSILIISVIFIVIMLSNSSNNDLYALVYHNDEIVYKLSLEEDKVYKIDNTNVVVEVKDNKIRIIESDCNDHICVNQGFISKNNQAITCLPNKIYIIICSKGEGVDSVV